MSEKSPTDDRRFGTWVGMFVVVGSMIGSGILTTSGYTLQATGNPAALLGLWVIGGVLALCGAVTIAELATAMPRSGGDYVFVREAYGRIPGFVSGWATFVLGFAAPIAFVAKLSLTYLIAPFAATMSPNTVGLLVQIGASVVLLVIGVTHMLGHRHSSSLQLTATIVTAVILITLAVGGILFGRGDWNHFSVGGWPANEHWPALAVGMFYVGFAYGGWNAAGYLAGEIRDPARALPRAMIGGASLVIVLYLLVNVAYVYALDPIAMTRLSVDDVEAEPVAKMAASALFGNTAAGLISIALGLGLLATVSAGLLAGPRIAYAMAVDGVFPRFAARLHATRRTPAAATAIMVLFAAVPVWSASLEKLLQYVGVGFAAISCLTVASVLPIRGRTDLPHPYRMRLFPLPPLFYLIMIGSAIVYMLISAKDWEARLPGLLSLVTILLGIPLSTVLGRSKR